MSPWAKWRQRASKFWNLFRSTVLSIWCLTRYLRRVRRRRNWEKNRWEGVNLKGRQPRQELSYTKRLEIAITSFRPKLAVRLNPQTTMSILQFDIQSCLQWNLANQHLNRAEPIYRQTISTRLSWWSKTRLKMERLSGTSPILKSSNRSDETSLVQVVQRED